MLVATTKASPQHLRGRDALKKIISQYNLYDDVSVQ